MGWGLLGAFTLLTLLSGGAVVWFGDKLALFAFIVPIVFLFIAIGAFLLLLLHYADTLHAWRPATPVSALGLPDGSIRAFLTIGPTSGSDADGKAAGKLEGLKTKLAEAFAALRAATETARQSPDDAAAVLAARDKAKVAHDVVASAETKLKEFIDKKDPAVL